jgi:hypothetical protein
VIDDVSHSRRLRRAHTADDEHGHPPSSWPRRELKSTQHRSRFTWDVSTSLPSHHLDARVRDLVRAIALQPNRPCSIRAAARVLDNKKPSSAFASRTAGMGFGVPSRAIISTLAFATWFVPSLCNRTNLVRSAPPLAL